MLPSLPLCCAIPVTLSGKVSRGGRAPQTTAPGLLVTRLNMDYSPSAEFVVRRQLIIVQCKPTEPQLLDFKLVTDGSVFGELQVASDTDLTKFRCKNQSVVSRVTPRRTKPVLSSPVLRIEYERELGSSVRDDQPSSSSVVSDRTVAKVERTINKSL